MIGTATTDPVQIRPWRTGDEVLLAEIGDEFSLRSLYSRFHGGYSRLPKVYLRQLAAAWSQRRWDAVLAIHRGRVIGWAEYARGGTDPNVADLGVLVVDAWQHRGLGPTLARAVLERAAAAGLTALRADVLIVNRAARAMIESLSGPNLHAERDGEVVCYTVPLVPYFDHPAISA
ncbi:MAG TPA: GNAT family N-acetyltransferase [Pseudonocardiaceae bacterium]